MPCTHRAAARRSRGDALLSPTTPHVTWTLATLALACVAPKIFPGGPPDVPLVTHRREAVRFRELIRGEVVLLHFMVTGDHESCPETTENLVEVQNDLGD